MAERSFNARIVQKHDTEENWNKATNFIPKKGEIIIYDIDATHSYERCKIGDGVANVNLLPFLSNASNLENGSGVKSIEQVINNGTTATIPISTKNPNAVTLGAPESVNIGAVGESTSAFGGASNATGKRSHAEGTNTVAIGKYSHAEGDNSVALGNDSHAEGNTTVSKGQASHAEGHTTQATGVSSHAEGIKSIAEGNYSHSEGNETHANGLASHSEGTLSVANGENSHSEGASTQANGQNSHASGYKTVASGKASYAEGSQTNAEAYASHTEGENTSVKTQLPSSSSGGGGSSGGSTGTPDDPGWNIEEHLGEKSHAEGTLNTVYGYSAHAEGFKTTAFGHISHVEGASSQTGENSNGSISGGYAAHAEGTSTKAIGSSSHTEGYKTETLGEASHAEGANTHADGYTSHSEGKGTHSSGDYSHAEGADTYATGEASHAEGMSASSYGALGIASHAEGYYTLAKGWYSHSEGTYTESNGVSSHAEGDHNTASGYASHAEGHYTLASHENSHTEGFHTMTSAEYQHVEGKYNADNPNALHIIGNGTSGTDRKNAFVSLFDGRAKVQSAPVDNDDVVRKLELDKKLDKTGGTITGSLTISQDLIVNGTTSTVDTQNLKVADKLIYVAKNNTVALTSPAGLITPKYDGTNNGGIVYDNTGTAYVGDIALDSNGNVDVNNSDLQPIATRNSAIADGNIVEWNDTNKTLVDSSKKVSDFIQTTGGTMTGKLVAPQIETGTGSGNYFQCSKLRGQGDANTYYHAIDFGYAGHDHVDFHEYGGLFNFYKNTVGTADGGQLIGSITDRGFVGGAELTGTPTAPTAAKGTNTTQIATT